jgi:katanin p60 ATPase-containing subunit A1
MRAKSVKSPAAEDSSTNTSSNNLIEVTGQSALPKENAEDVQKDKREDFFDVRVLKGLPNYEDVPEFRDLAAYL